jgi:uncharacterized protein (DUF2141 family)
MHRLSRLAVAAAFATLLLTAQGASAQPSIESSAAPRPNVLRILVSGAGSSEGHVRVDVCTRSEFLHECRFSGAAPATPGVTAVEVRDLPPGIYAVQAYHDRNDNHQVDRNRLGLPTEAVGFSNDAPVSFRGPSFGAAAFTFAGGEQTISLRLRRFVP